MICVYSSREACRLAGLVENMMGVLVCQQVVLLNDGRADSLAGWVGCGMTV